MTAHRVDAIAYRNFFDPSPARRRRGRIRGKLVEQFHLTVAKYHEDALLRPRGEADDVAANRNITSLDKRDRATFTKKNNPARAKIVTPAEIQALFATLFPMPRVLFRSSTIIPLSSTFTS